MSVIEKKETHLVRNEHTKGVLLHRCSEIELGDKPLLVTIEPLTDKGTTKQMRLDGVWRRVINENTGESVERIRRYNKLHFGVPILYESSDGFANLWDSQCAELGEEAQIALMEFMDVTKEFGKTQYTMYLRDIEMFYSEQGIRLPHPDDLYYESMGFLKR